MAPQAKQKPPKIGEMVHVVPQSAYGDRCVPMVVTEIKKNHPDKDLSPDDYRDYERLITITGEPFHVSVNRSTAWEAEYSADGHRLTWHPIDSCPLEA